MFFGSSIDISKQILDYGDTKNNVISNNLANISNPNYKRKYMDDLTFEQELNQMKRTRSNHIDTVTNNTYEIKTEKSYGRNDGNNVNLDKEIVDLTENQYMFQINSTILQKEYSKLSEAII